MAVKIGGTVRVSFPAVKTKAALREKLGKKIVPLTKNPKLRNAIAKEYAEVITPYVPMSNKKVEHHLNQYAIADGRVIWHRLSDKSKNSGEKRKEMAGILFHNVFHKKWVKRYKEHKPRDRWTEAINLKTNWNKFIIQSKRVLLAFMKGEL